MHICIHLFHGPYGSAAWVSDAGPHDGQVKLKHNIHDTIGIANIYGLHSKEYCAHASATKAYVSLSTLTLAIGSADHVNLRPTLFIYTTG